ncbi:hypothetical protein PIB30_052871 [Stylosanthes scabra]|uniref:Uncharacterized protein n=1 Tax=Stylosanthes scabra TaxID=79078 RepID=A0ABU6WIA3_9FABA|nr:hypothetical protein [Stylosanthes scabra]
MNRLLFKSVAKKCGQKGKFLVVMNAFPNAGHELMRRLASRARRLLGINPKYGFSTIDCHGIYQSGPYCPCEYAPYPGGKWMIIQKPSGSYPSHHNNKYHILHRFPKLLTGNLSSWMARPYHT